MWGRRGWCSDGQTDAEAASWVESWWPVHREASLAPPPSPPPSGTTIMDSLNPNPSALSLYFQPIFFLQAKDVSEDPQRSKRRLYLRKKKYKDPSLA